MKKKTILLVVGVCLLLSIAGIAVLLIFAQKEEQDWNEYQIQFEGKSKHIYIKLDLDDDDKPQKDSDTKYTLETGPSEIYSYEYFKSLDDLKDSLVESHDSSDEQAGGGTYYDNQKVKVGDHEYTTLLGYYNPLLATTSGEYDPSGSTVITTGYVYEIEETGEVILFGLDTSYDGSVHEPEMDDIQLVDVIE